MNLIRLIKSDLERIAVPTMFNFLRWYFFPQGSTFPFQVWYRIMSKINKHKFLKYTIGIFVYFIYRHFSYKYGININTNIEVGPGLRIVHGYGVFLNCKKIGANFTVYQNVTCGVKNGSIPVIEDDVMICPGAVVVGDVILKKGGVVGANSFVNRTVESNCIVGGIPAKEIGKSREKK